MSTYQWSSADSTEANEILIPELKCILSSLIGARRILDVGCGSGHTSQMLSALGYDVLGVDQSETGLAIARKRKTTARFEAASVYDDLRDRFGLFPVVISTEVIEHLYDPRLYIQRLFDVLEPGGHAIISTPYNGYWKNLAIAVVGGFDRHVNPLYLHGHIKFWSEKTLSTLMMEEGFSRPYFRRCGRISPIAKSMIAVASKPKETS